MILQARENVIVSELSSRGARLRETHGHARSFSLLLPPACGKGRRRRLTRVDIEGEALLPHLSGTLAFVGQAVTNRIANAPYVLDLGLERPAALACSNFILL
jgi:hypothetical protein